MKKRLLAILLSVTMIMSGNMTAFATEDGLSDSSFPEKELSAEVELPAETDEADAATDAAKEDGTKEDATEDDVTKEDELTPDETEDGASQEESEEEEAYEDEAASEAAEAEEVEVIPEDELSSKDKPSDKEGAASSLLSAESARSAVLSMNIYGLDGKTYRVGNFSEDYVAIFFGRSTCYNTQSMVKKAAQLKNKGKSIKIVIMDVDSVDDGLESFASQNNALGSLHSNNNGNMWSLYRALSDSSSGSLTLPLSIVMDSGRNIIYWNTGKDVNGLASVFTDPTDFEEIAFDMTYGQTEARTILDMVNSFRTGSDAWAWNESNSTKEYYTGLGELQYDYGLEQVAMKRAAEIALYYSHTRPNGSDCFSVYSVIGSCGENIAAGHKDASSVNMAWREDDKNYSGQGHRRNMLGKDFKYIGIGHVVAGGIHYWVEEFNSVPTSLSYTSPDDSRQGVYVQIDKDNIVSRNLYLSYVPPVMETGDIVDLPEIYEKIATTNSWPSGGQYVYGVDPDYSGYDTSLIRISKEKKTIEALAEGDAAITISADGLSGTLILHIEDKPNVDRVVVKKYASLEDANADRNATVIENGGAVEVPYGQKIYLKGVGIPIVEKTNFNPATTAAYEQNEAFEFNSTTGEVTAKRVGSSNISFTSNKDNTKKATISVKVKEVPITGISFDESNIFMNVSSERELELKKTPEVTSQTLDDAQWQSTDTSVVTVEGSGKKVVIRSGEKEGTATVKAKLGSLSASVQVEVCRIVKFEDKELEFTSKPGISENLTVKLAGNTYKESDLKWTSSDPSAIKVEKGKITIQKNVEEVTKVVITATTSDGLYSDTCEITLNPWARAAIPVASLKIGDVEKNSVLILSTGDAATKIYYTTDYDEKDGISTPAFDANGNPLSGTLLYDEAIVIDKTMTVSAISRKEGFQDSKVVSFKYVVTFNWGDVNTDKLKALFKDASEVPDGLWYAFGNEQEGYSSYYTGSADSSFAREYTGAKVTFNQDIRVFHGNRRLWENRDYTVSYANNQKAASPADKAAPTVSIKGKGNYKGVSSFKFTINPLPLTDAVITSGSRVTIPAGTKLSSLKPVVYHGERKLTVNKDYDLVFYQGTATEENRIENKTAAVLGTEYVVEIVSHVNGNYTGKAKDKVLVSVVDSKDKSVVQMSKVKVSVPGQVYDPQGIDIKGLFAYGIAKVTNGKTELAYGQDYEVVVLPGAGIKGDKACDIGNYNLIIRGTGKNQEGSLCYQGDKAAILKVTGIPASKVKVGGLATNVDYKGSAFSINDLYKKDKTGFEAVTLYTVDKGSNVPVSSYDVEISGNGEVGKLTVSFKLKGQYTGTIKKTVTVKGANLAGAELTVGEAVYSKAGSIPAVSVALGGKTLTEGIDYTLSFKNNTKIASKGAAPTVMVKGIGNYAGTKSQTFVIKKALITEAAVVELGDKIYSPKKGSFKVVPKLMDGGKQLAAGTDIAKINPATDYKYYYAESGKIIPDTAVVPAGTVIQVKVIVTCPETSPYREGTYVLKESSYRIIDTGKDIKSASVKVNNPSRLVFDNGKAVVPVKAGDLTVKLGKSILGSSDYDIVSVTQNRFLGTAKVKIQGKGAYGGTKTFTFRVGARAMN